MPLRNYAILEIELSSRTGIFKLESLEDESELNRQMLVGNRGQVIQQLIELSPGLDSGDESDGINFDLGQATNEHQLAFEILPDETSDYWGDGSGNNRWDQPDGHAHTKAQLLKEYARTARTDTENPAYLYWGEWSDGTYASSAGIFGEPIPVIIQSISFEVPLDDTAVPGSVIVQRTDALPDNPASTIPDV